MLAFYKKNKEKVVLYILIVVFFGLFFSKAITSLSIAALSLIGLTSFQKKNFKNLLKPIYLVFLLTYFLFVISIFNTTNFQEYSKLLLLEAPLLFIPLFFAGYQLKEKTIDFAMKFYIVITSLVAASTLSKFLINYRINTQKIIENKAIPAITGIPHYQFSLLIVIAILGVGVLFLNKTNPFKRIWFYLACFLVIFIHIVAYRTALFCFYGLLSYSFLIAFFKYKNRTSLIKFGFLLIALLIGAVYFITPLNLKVKATYNDISRITSHKNFNNYSISQRYAASLNSLEIVKKNLWFGVAPADLNMEMQKQYEVNSYLLIPENRIPLHNQYLFYLSSFGLIAFVLWFFLWIKSLYLSFIENHLHHFLLVLASIAFLVDAFFQMQVGTISILLFIFLLKQRNIDLKF